MLKITKQQTIKALEYDLTSSELTELADIFMSLSKRNTPEDDEKAMMIWKCISISRNSANITGFHGAKSTCGRSISHEIITIMCRRSKRQRAIETAFEALRAL